MLSEESVAKGVRRITALTGHAAADYVRKMDRTLRDVAVSLRVAPEQLAGRVEAMQAEIKKLRKAGPAGPAADGLTAETVGQSKFGAVLVARGDGLDSAAMRSMCDQQRQKGAAAMFIGRRGRGQGNADGDGCPGCGGCRADEGWRLGEGGRAHRRRRRRRQTGRWPRPGARTPKSWTKPLRRRQNTLVSGWASAQANRFPLTILTRISSFPAT